MSKIKVDKVETSETLYGIQVDAYKAGERVTGGTLPNETQAMLYIQNELELPDDTE